MTALRVVREPPIAAVQFGALYINDRWQCWTLEGATAVPAGVYSVRVTMAPQFCQLLPELVAVPGFADVRIHGVETHAGGLLVGHLRAETQVLESRLALGDLLRRLLRSDYLHEPMLLHLEDPPGYHLAAA